MTTASFASTVRGFPHVRLFAALLVAAVVAGGAYAFTASNTVPNSTAGSGNGTVSGYTVSNVHYVLNTTTPVNIDSLTFTITPTVPSTSSGKVVVQAALSVGGPSTYTCTTNTTGELVTCLTATPQLTSDKLTGLTVIAAQ